MPGRWIYDEYGNDAELVGTDTGATLRLRVSESAIDTPRQVRFVPDATTA